MNRFNEDKVEIEEATEDVVTYFTIKGKQDDFDIDGFPVQEKENKDTLAKRSGNRRLVKIDNMGKFFNPYGMYASRANYERWLQVNEKTFNFYLNFLKTKNQSFLLNAERNAI